MEITEEIINNVKSGKITKAVLQSGQTLRLFVSTDNTLCYYRKRSPRYGYALYRNDIKKFIYKKEKTEIDLDKKEFLIISKFRKQALKAKFTNEFIKSCLALPDTFEKWVEEGKKSPYQYDITTGCKITGELVSIKSLVKKLSTNEGLQLLNAIQNKTNYYSSRFDFYGYDGSIRLKIENNGTFRGCLSKEYRNCGNGYYYLLINDDYFIGYDVD